MSIALETATPEQGDHSPDRASRTRELFERASHLHDEAECARLHQEIVVLNLEVADALASRYSGRGLDSDDLCQVARLALVRVVPQFRPEYGKDFLVYAVPSIVGALRKHFRDTGWTIRPPRRVQEAHQAIGRAGPALAQLLGREATIAELGEETGIGEETLREASTASDCYAPVSLDAAVHRDAGDAERTLSSLVGGEDPEFDRSEARMMLEPLMAGLEPRDRKVLELRFVRGLTQSEVGELISVSQMQVSRIQSRILAALRRQIGELPDQRMLGAA